MATHTRNPGTTSTGVSMTVSQLSQIDERAAALGISRSKYIQKLVEDDLAEKGPLVIRPKPAVTTEAAAAIEKLNQENGAAVKAAKAQLRSSARKSQ